MHCKSERLGLVASSISGPSMKTLMEIPRYSRRSERRRPMLRVLAVVLLLVLGLGSCAIATAWDSLGAHAEGARLARLERSPEWKDGRIQNKQRMWTNFWGGLGDWLSKTPDAEPSAPVNVATDTKSRLALPAKSGLRVTWFGHSSSLVEIDGARVLIDPIWSDRPSPIAWAGPKRWYAPPLKFEDLPRIDVVLISHDHYDHLDRATIGLLAKGAAKFVVPLGIGAHLSKWAIPPDRIIELDWWEQASVGELTIIATPSRHASGRVGPDSDQTLWAGFAVLGKSHRVWYSGDTGFHNDLQEIGKRFGPFDLTLIESGQYDANWPDWHLGPELAVGANRRVQGKVMLPVHWGLFKLGLHGWTEPIERVLAAAACAGVTVISPRPGEPVEPSFVLGPERWWPAAKWKKASETPIVATQNGDPYLRMEQFACSPSEPKVPSP